MKSELIKLSSHDAAQCYVLDRVLSLNESVHLYETLMGSPHWYLSRTSKGGRKKGEVKLYDNAFAGLNIFNNINGVLLPILFGHFDAIRFRITEELRRSFRVHLPEEVKRIHINALNGQSKTSFHKDTDTDNAWSIVGFLNPVWDTANGGELCIEGQKIEYMPARFVVFKSNMLHRSEFFSHTDLNLLRLSVSYILS